MREPLGYSLRSIETGTIERIYVHSYEGFIKQLERAFELANEFYDKCDTDEERKEIDDQYFWLVDHLRQKLERHVSIAAATASSVM